MRLTGVLRRLMQGARRSSVAARLNGSPEPGPLLDEVRATSVRLRRLLDETILPFWTRDIVDTANGGYRMNHDGASAWLGPSAKHIVTQSRALWFYARLVRAGYDRNLLGAAQSGVAFLRDRMWDRERGGFHWSVDYTGHTVLQPAQRVYGQAFALFALSEYARSAGCSEARELSARTFLLLEERFHDPVHGGYFALDLHTSGEPADVATEKWQNDHVHLLEALVSYDRLESSPLLRERIRETMLILSRTVVRPDHASSRDRHSREWVPDRSERRVSFGHDVECGWLLLDACDAVGMSPSLLLPLVAEMFGTLVSCGLDRRRGGVFSSGRVDASADDRRKLWWVQAEVLVGCLDLYVRTGMPEAGSSYLAVLRWINDVQADWTHGEWHECIAPSGSAEGCKAGPWKGPYHSGRAMLECLGRLERLPQT